MHSAHKNAKEGIICPGPGSKFSQILTKIKEKNELVWFCQKYFKGIHLSKFCLTELNIDQPK